MKNKHRCTCRIICHVPFEEIDFISEVDTVIF